MIIDNIQTMRWMLQADSSLEANHGAMRAQILPSLPQQDGVSSVKEQGHVPGSMLLPGDTSQASCGCDGLSSKKDLYVANRRTCSSPNREMVLPTAQLWRMDLSPILGNPIQAKVFSLPHPNLPQLSRRCPRGPRMCGGSKTGGITGCGAASPLAAVL